METEIVSGSLMTPVESPEWEHTLKKERNHYEKPAEKSVDTYARQSLNVYREVAERFVEERVKIIPTDGC